MATEDPKALSEEVSRLADEALVSARVLNNDPAEHYPLAMSLAAAALAEISVRGMEQCEKHKPANPVEVDDLIRESSALVSRLTHTMWRQRHAKR